MFTIYQHCSNGFTLINSFNFNPKVFTDKVTEAKGVR